MTLTIQPPLGDMVKQGASGLHIRAGCPAHRRCDRSSKTDPGSDRDAVSAVDDAAVVAIVRARPRPRFFLRQQRPRAVLPHQVDQGAISIVDRVIEVLPRDAQQQVRVQLAGTLHGVISRSLAPKTGGGRIAAREILLLTGRRVR